MPKKTACTDHLGNEFPSIRQMCRHYGVSITTYRARMKRGMPMGDALTAKKIAPGGARGAKECQDHLGNAFPSVKQMCQHYGIAPSTFCKRLERGATVEDALTKKVIGAGRGMKRECQDHLGNTFSCIRQMCRHYGIPFHEYSARRKSGMPLGDALTAAWEPNRTPTAKKCRDHLGNEYGSYKEMCRAYGIPEERFHARIRGGWPLGDALTKGKMEHGRHLRKECEDHLGRRYPSVMDMCAAYGVKESTFYMRRRKGKSVEEALMQKKRQAGP